MNNVVEYLQSKQSASLAQCLLWRWFHQLKKNVVCQQGPSGCCNEHKYKIILKQLIGGTLRSEVKSDIELCKILCWSKTRQITLGRYSILFNEHILDTKKYGLTAWNITMYQLCSHASGLIHIGIWPFLWAFIQAY